MTKSLLPTFSRSTRINGSVRRPLRVTSAASQDLRFWMSASRLRRCRQVGQRVCCNQPLAGEWTGKQDTNILQIASFVSVSKAAIRHLRIEGSNPSPSALRCCGVSIVKAENAFCYEHRDEQADRRLSVDPRPEEHAAEAQRADLDTRLAERNRSHKTILRERAPQPACGRAP